MGDYLFTDPDFVRNLSTGHRNVFEKLFDEIKYLCKAATAGSKEARQLEKVKKAFEDAYRAETKNPTADGGVRYSITEPFVDNNGAQFDSAVLLDTEFFDGLNPRNWGGKLRDFVEMRAETDPFVLPVVDENGNVQQLQFANTQDRVTKNGQSNHKVLDKLSSGSDNISKLAVIHIDEIVDVSDADVPYYTTDNSHQWLDQNGWLHRTANVINTKNGNIYSLTFDIAKAKDGRHILYATNGNIKRVGNVQVNSLTVRGSGQNSNSANNVAQSDPTVKRKDLEYQYAVSRGDMKTAQKMVDQAAEDAGYTVRAYHGSGEKFNTFSYGHIGSSTGVGILGDCFYFSDTKQLAKMYGKEMYAVRLRMENTYHATESDQYKINTQNLIKQGYDSVDMTLPGGGKIYGVFDNTQMKSVDPVAYDDNGDVIPLSERFNPAKTDIRYSLSEQSKDVAPVRDGIYGKDIALEDIGPVRSEVRTNINHLNDSGVDTGRVLDYDSTVNETEGGVVSNERRKETRDAFYRRANEEVRTVRERGEIACGYVLAADKTGRAGQTEKALQELGIPVIVHEGLEANVDGITRVVQGDAASVAGDAVFVRNTLGTDPIETAGHEAFHFWKRSTARAVDVDAVTDNIDFASDWFIQFQTDIAESYFSEEVGIEDDGIDKLSEEIFAYITGLVHAGDSNNIVRPFLRDYDAVKAAWDALVEAQAQAPFISQAETNSDLDEVAPIGSNNDSGKVSIPETPTAENAAGVFFDETVPVREEFAKTESVAAESGSEEARHLREDISDGKQRKWVKTSTESDAVDGKVLPDDLNQELIHYQPISNKKTLSNANAKLDRVGYEKSVVYLESQFAFNKATLDDIALGERLIQEAVKMGVRASNRQDFVCD